MVLEESQPYFVQALRKKNDRKGVNRDVVDHSVKEKYS